MSKYRESQGDEATQDATGAGATAREDALEREVQELKAELAFVEKQ